MDLYKGLWVNFKRENLSICINVEFVGVTIEKYFENVLLRDHFDLNCGVFLAVHCRYKQIEISTIPP